MTDTVSCILLGIIQGLTEFLPVSSSAHLVFFQNLLGWKEPDILFDVLLHFGTLFAVIIVMFQEILLSVKKIKIMLNLATGTAATAIVVFPFKHFIEKFFEDAVATGFLLIITGFILFFAWLRLEKSGERISIENLGFLGAFLTGLAQGIAVLPGISRSGATIATGIFSGMERVQAVKFSFLLSVPAILGAGMVKFKDSGFDFSVLTVNYFYGMLAAFLSGIFAVYFMIKIIKKVKLYWFSVYCWLVGLTMVVLYR